MREIKGFDNSFMQPEIEEGVFYEVTDSYGETSIIPGFLVGECENLADTLISFADYLETSGEPVSFEKIEGFGARLSAPGYLDCTEWTVFETEDEAINYLEENYGNFE